MAIKRLMAKAMPVYLVEQVTTEVRLATKRMFTAHSVRRSLASQNGCRVTILDHPQKSIALGERLRCFNPIFRFSNAALSFLHQSLLDGWCGHNEVLFPTLLYHNGFAIADIGGKGRFRPSDLRENFYTESEANSIGLLDTGTMRYRPAFVTVGREKNKLYHPVKPLSSTLRKTIGRQCHRWLPSSVVQMLKKVRNTSSAQL
jgi:hypothetical protein